MAKDDDQSDAEMPEPPDFTALYQEQSAKLAEVYAASSAAFDVFAARDAQIGLLSDAYQQEIVKVLTIAKAVTTPVTAIAAIPPVLAAANEAFAKAPVTEQAVIALVEQSFSAFKGE